MSTKIPIRLIDGIEQSDIDNWNARLDAETDPTVPSYVKSIAQSDIDNWNSSKSSITTYAELVTAISTKTGKYTIAGAITLGANITIPANVQMWFEGGSIALNGHTITGTNTEIHAPAEQIFYGATSTEYEGTSFLGTWKSPVSYLQWFGNVTGGSISSRTPFKNAIILSNHVHLPAGTYTSLNQESPGLYIFNKKITGDGDATIWKIQTRLANATNVVFENIYFQWDVDEFQTSYPTIYIQGGTTISDICFNNCKFTTGQTNVINGITLTPNYTVGLVENITFDNCVFHDVGRMGIEGLAGTDGGNRVRRVKIRNCYFLNVLHHGISLVGDCRDTLVDGCTFDNVYYSCLELTGYNVRVINNVFKNLPSNGSPMWSTSTSGNTKNMVYSNNICEDAFSGQLLFKAVEGLTISGNVTKMKAGYNNGQIAFDNSCSKVIVNGDVILKENYDRAINVLSGSNILVSNVIFNRSDGTNGYDIQVQGTSTDIYISNCVTNRSTLVSNSGTGTYHIFDTFINGVYNNNTP